MNERRRKPETRQDQPEFEEAISWPHMRSEPSRSAIIFSRAARLIVALGALVAIGVLIHSQNGKLPVRIVWSAESETARQN